MLKKLTLWIPKILGGGFGIVQAVVKFIKEVLTLIVDILYPVIPSEKFQTVTDKIRDFVNEIDEILEQIKQFLLNIEVE